MPFHASKQKDKIVNTFPMIAQLVSFYLIAARSELTLEVLPFVKFLFLFGSGGKHFHSLFKRMNKTYVYSYLNRRKGHTSNH